MVLGTKCQVILRCRQGRLLDIRIRRIDCRSLDAEAQAFPRGEQQRPEQGLYATEILGDDKLSTHSNMRRRASLNLSDCSLGEGEEEEGGA